MAAQGAFLPTHEPPLTPSPEATVLAPAGEPAGTFVAGPFHIPLRGWSDKGAVDENTLITVTKDGEAVNIAQHIWYNLHDGQPDNCPTAALSFSPPDFDPAAAGEFWGFFEDYLCSLGLRYNDGLPKEGWGCFIESLAAYTAGSPPSDPE